jgi:TonB-linked SusC/RagA family outer membrane protein
MESFLFGIRRWNRRAVRGIARAAASSRPAGALLLLPCLLLLGATRADAQGTSVGGVVLHEQSLAPVAGVQVVIEGTTRGTLTGPNGRFLITGLQGSEVTLRVMRVGFRPVTRTARVGDMDVRISLAEQAVELDAVVVTGTAGAVRTRTLGNAVTQISAAEVVATQPIQSVQDLIRGRAPGVVITPPTGMIGGGSQIRIRGISSLSLSTRPLLFVDGIRVDNGGNTGPGVQGLGNAVVSRINDINPDDIESIEIIKGPAAATLYGTEASNGVIQIITKRGAAGRSDFNMTVRQGANWFANAEGRMPVAYGRHPVTGQIESLNLVRQERERGTPIFRTGHLQGYDLSFSGGAENVRYFLSGSYDDQEGIERDNHLSRWSGRANLTVTPHPTIDVTGNLGYTSSDARLVWEGSGGGVMWSSTFPTLTRFYNADGSPHVARGFRTAPHEFFEHYFVGQQLGRFMGSVQLNHRPLTWFSHRLTVGSDVTREANDILAERTDHLIPFLGTVLGNRTAGRREVTNTTVDYGGTATYSLADWLTSATSVGGQFYRVFTTNVTATGTQFPAPGLTVVNAAAIQRGGESQVENATVGIYGQQQFGWRDRLFLTGALRADDNSAFGENFDLVYYPKASVSWVVSEEPFWQVPAFSTLRLRAAYGESGQQPAAFAALRTYAPTTGRGDVPAVTPQTVGNPDLGPERGKELELGFDSGFFGERVGIQFTYYDQRTTDAIVLRSIAPSSGFAGSQWVNIGEVMNRGVEMLLDLHPVSRPNFDWRVGFNVSTNQNEVLDLGGELQTLVLNAQFGLESRVGYPASSFFHRRILSAEVTPAGRTINPMCDGGPEAGGAPVPCEQAPFLYLGRTAPSREGAVTSSVTLYDRLRLGAVVDFKGGHVKWDGNLWVQCSIYQNCRQNLFPQEADPAQLAAFHRDLAIQSPYVQDAGFAMLRELTATFTLPPRTAGRIGASAASISMAGRNLHTWTRWTGLDPEVAYSGNWYEQNNTPQLAQFLTTINLNF